MALAAVVIAATLQLPAGGTDQPPTTGLPPLPGSADLRAHRSGGKLDMTSDRASLRKVVEAAIARRDVRAFPAALRSHLSRTDVRAFAAARPSGTIRYGVPAQDLSGDRLGDVLEIEAQVPSLRPVSITARRGTTGRPLWSMRVTDDSDVVPLPVGDLSGDRSGDVVLSRFEVLDAVGGGNCAVAACGEAGAGSYRWTISLLSGRNGRALWSRTFDGEIVFSTGLAEPAAGGEVVLATNGLVVPLISDDHNGDRLPDLILDAFDAVHAAGTSYAGATIHAPTTLIGTHAMVVSGRTGADVLTRDQSLEPGGAFLLPMTDATGDRRHDLLWQNAVTAATPAACDESGCVANARSRVDVEVIDGASLETSWARTIDDSGLQDAVAVPADADPTSDGRSDLFLYASREPNDGAPTFTVGVMSGADGRIVWSVPADPDGSIEAIGRLDGKRGDDLLVSSFVLLSPPEEQPLRVELRFDRVDGRTGRRRLRTRRVFSDTKTRTIALIQASVMRDGNGDRVADVVTDALSIDSDAHDIISDSYVESGRTGRQLWSRRAIGFAIAQSAGDATKDRLDDVLDVHVGEDDIAVSLIDLAPVRRVWRRVDPVPDAFLAVTGIDQSGRGGDDQVYSRLRVVPGGFVSRIDAIEGRVGGFTWGVGPSLPARPRGKIAGTVRDTAARGIGEICAVAYTTSGILAGSGTTSSNGMYHIGRLPEGRYKVRFADCGVQRYHERWYKQQNDIRAANVVVVNKGGTRGGVDAVLVRK